MTGCLNEWRLERPLDLELCMNQTLSADRTLDATGLSCPEPVMMLHQHVRDLPAGGLLEVIATDPSTRRDIPKFCVFLGHELVQQDEEGGTYRYWIRKKSD
jgi:tRNA 2-thiouridine synthesizing protein A